MVDTLVGPVEVSIMWDGVGLAGGRWSQRVLWADGRTESGSLETFLPDEPTVAEMQAVVCLVAAGHGVTIEPADVTAEPSSGLASWVKF